MDKDKTNIERTVLLATSIVGGIGGLFTAINGLSDSVRKTVGIFAGFNEWQLGVAAVVLVAVSWWLFRLSRRRRSVLLRPEALRLERANPAHLFGRREDIDQLVRLCREEPLVFLEGELGAGKSALLQAGLVPALRAHPGLLPIYVESLAGSDWERDPRTFLATALRSALDEASREMMGLETVPGASAARTVIEAIPAKLGRTPLIVLDQFDDYQLRHHERFLSRKTWLKPGRLCEQNGFWRDLRELLASATIHLVVVTRTDTASGLTSVRFIEPETYRLDRLGSHFVGPLLAALVKEGAEQPVISDPEYGWTTLLTRLAADLERAGTILPQQLKIVLAGLGTLPGRVLSVAAYERAGGAAGLEARFVENRVAKVARLHGVTEEGVRAALLNLVDTETGQKTTERRNDDLLVCIDPSAPAKARRALNQLAQEEMIRRRVDPGTDEISWLLDHDYLARAVREADRRANRWQRAFADGAKILAGAGDSWARWWRALLPPRTQLRFLYDRLRGRFHYGEHRLYAVKSLQRFGPMVGILLLIVAAGAYEWERRTEDRIAKSAEDILNGLEFEQQSANERDVDALLRLASTDQKVRQHALTLVLTNPDRARVFIRQPQMVVRAIAGVSPRFRDWANSYLMRAPFSSNQYETSVATSTAALLIGPEGIPLNWWLTAIKVTTDPDALAALGAGLGAVAAKLSDSQAKEAVEPFLAAIKGTTNSHALAALGTGLRAVAAKLSDSQAQAAVEPFLTAIKGTTNYAALAALGAGLGALPATLSDSQAKQAVEPFLAAIKGTTFIFDLTPVGAGLRALTAKLSDKEAQEAIEPFLAAFKGTTNPYALAALGAGLGALPATLSDSQAKQAVGPFLAAIKGTTDPYALAAVGAGLGAVAAKLGDKEAQEAIEPLLAAIKGTTDPDALAALGAGLGALPTKLSDSQAKEAVEPFLAAFKGTTNPHALAALGAGLGALPTKLSDSEAKETVERFLAAFKGTIIFIPEVPALGTGLEALTAKLSDSQAKGAVEPLLSAIKGTTDRYALQALGAGLDALAAKLDRHPAKAVEVAVNEVLERTRYPETFGIYAELSARLTSGKPADHQVGTIFHLLRHPLSAGEPTEKLLAHLEQVPGVQAKFGGDLWKAVEWAEAEQKAGRLNGLDLNAPLHIK